MPDQSWLKKEFQYGYDSGDVLALEPDEARRKEEEVIGGSYREVFLKGLLPHLREDSRVLELGPGRGSWTRAILTHVARGEVQTADFQDVTPWLKPENYGGRLVCRRVTDNTFRDFPDDHFDVFWSFGVLCHNNAEDVKEILANARPKLVAGAVCVHQYADWVKMEASKGTTYCGLPANYRDLPDADIWWPRNDQARMAEIIRAAGYECLSIDLDLVKRDSIAVFRKA